MCVKVHAPCMVHTRILAIARVVRSTYRAGAAAASQRAPLDRTSTEPRAREERLEAEELDDIVERNGV